MLPASKNYLFAFRTPQNTYQLLTIEQDSSKRERKTHGLCVSSPQSPQHIIRKILSTMTFSYHSKIKHKAKGQITGSGKTCVMTVTYFFFFFFFFLISHQFYTHHCIHVNPNRPIQHTTIPTPPQFSPLGVHTFVLYICVWPISVMHIRLAISITPDIIF